MSWSHSDNFHTVDDRYYFSFQLGSQNQDLMSKNLLLQDRIKELEKQHSVEAVKLQQWLMRELGVCFAELESLVQVCVQRAEGQDPNISVLLGPKRKYSQCYMASLW